MTLFLNILNRTASVVLAFLVDWREQVLEPRLVRMMEMPCPGRLSAGAIGALSGAALGNAADNAEARNRAHYHAHQQAQQVRLAQAVTLSDVVSMTHAGLGDDVIITQIRTKGLVQPTCHE